MNDLLHAANSNLDADSRMLIANLSSVETDFDREHGIRMISPNHWQSAKHKLFGYSTVRQVRSAIKRKLAKKAAR